MEIGNVANVYGFVVLNDTKWHHVVMAYDGSKADNAGRLKGYVDGARVTLDYDGTTIPASTGSNASSPFIGFYEAGGVFSEGSIDDFSIYNRALSATEVQALYNVGR